MLPRQALVDFLRNYLAGFIRRTLVATPSADGHIEVEGWGSEAGEPEGSYHHELSVSRQFAKRLLEGLGLHIAFAIGRWHAAEHQEKRQLLTMKEFVTTFKKWTTA